MPVLHSSVRIGFLMFRAAQGANSDAAKLQHLVVGLRWKRVRISGGHPVLRLLIKSRCSDGTLGWKWSQNTFVFLKTDSFWRTHHAELARQSCVPKSPRVNRL